MEQVANRNHPGVQRGLRLDRAVALLRRFDRLLLYPLLIPALLLAVGNDGFGFDPPGGLDAFVYLGYFWHYPEHLWVFDDNSNYKISRLPWVLPGFAAHASFSPVVAARVLAYCTLAGAALALYLLVRDMLRDRRAAAFVSILFACCTGMHAPAGWYYHVLAASGYYLWSCWMLTRAASAEQRTAAWAVGAGACYAAAVHTHLFLAVFAPLLILLWWGALSGDGDQRWRRLGTTIVAAVGGAAGLTAGLAAVNRVTGGDWLFFLPQIELATKLSRHDPWWLTGDQWLPNATYLVLPLALTITGLSSGSFSWKAEQRRRGVLVVLPCLALALTCLFQFGSQVTTLDYDYMAFVLYLHAFPAAATLVWRPEDRGRLHAGLLIFAAIVVIAPLLLLMPAYLPGLMARIVERAGLAHASRLLPPLLFALAGVAVARVAPRPLRLPVVALWFSIINAWIAPQPSAYGFRTAGTRKAMLETFRDADAFTSRLDPSLIGIKYWISSEDLPTPRGPVPSQQVFDSFVATRAWLTNLFARSSPGLPIPMLTNEHLARAPCVGILSSRERQTPIAEEMMAHYASLQEPLAVLAARHFEREGFAFALTVLKPVHATADASVGSACSPDVRPSSE